MSCFTMADSVGRTGGRVWLPLKRRQTTPAPVKKPHHYGDHDLADLPNAARLGEHEKMNYSVGHKFQSKNS